MKLPFSLFNKKKSSADYYLGLILSDEKASAIVLHVSEGTIKTVNTHEEHFTKQLEDIPLDELINIVDRTVSTAEDILPPNVQTNNTIFGVKESWLDTESKKIKKEYLEKLKKVCNSLDLSPLGFMVTTEALVHLVQDEEGAPLSAIMAEISHKTVTLKLLRGGKVIETVSHAHLDSAPATADKLMSHFTVPVLPARIVLYQTKVDERTSHAFSTHQWSKSLPFLHIPQITVLPEKFDMRSVLFGAAKQMGLTVSETDQRALKSAFLTQDAHVVETPEEIVRNNEHHNLATLAEADEDTMNETVEQAADFGFVIDKDVPKQEPKPAQQDSFGGTLHNSPLTTPMHKKVDQDEQASDEPNEPFSETVKKRLHSLPINKLTSLPVLHTAKSFFAGKKTPLKIILPIAAILILFIGTIIYYNFGMKATIRLSIAPDLVDEDKTISFAVGGRNAFDDDVIAAQNITAAIDAEATTKATGKEEVGEKAEGTVTFYNNDGDPIKLSKGTEISASNGQVFIVNDDVTVASASGDIFSGTEPGTKDGSVTAKDIGDDGNVPSGTRFSVGSNSNLAARNDKAFSGGSSKELTVISEDDLEVLRQDIIKKAQGKGKTELSKQAAKDLTVLPVVGGSSLEKPQYSGDVGDEAKEVTLKAIVVFSGVAYDEADLKEYVESVFQEKYDGESFADDSIKQTLSDIDFADDETVEADVSMQAGLIPEIDKDEILATSQGKSAKETQRMVSSLPQVIQSEVVFSPPLPLLPVLFQNLPKQVSVEIISE